MKRIFKIKQSVLFLSTIIISNCASPPSSPAPELVKEIVVNTEPITDIAKVPPDEVAINSIYYNRYSMIIQWDASKDYDLSLIHI